MKYKQVNWQVKTDEFVIYAVMKIYSMTNKHILVSKLCFYFMFRLIVFVYIVTGRYCRIFHDVCGIIPIIFLSFCFASLLRSLFGLRSLCVRSLFIAIGDMLCINK